MCTINQVTKSIAVFHNVHGLNVAVLERRTTHKQTNKTWLTTTKLVMSTIFKIIAGVYTPKYAIFYKLLR